MLIPKGLYQEVAKEALKPPLSPLEELVACLKSTRPATKAVLFYGSCLQTGDLKASLLDLYLLVDSYRKTYTNPFLSLANYLLPPNVFYLEKDTSGGLLRTKYAVITLSQFLKATSPAWFHSYFWGRFCQPVQILYWEDEKAKERVLKALAQAVLTFLKNVFPVAPERGSVKELWLLGLRLSYRAELRPEAPARLESLWKGFGPYFLRVTRKAVSALPYEITLQGENYEAFVPLRIRKRQKQAWRLRIFLGKPLSVLRLAKATLTFQGGVDYALWKIERHTGKRLQVPPVLRKHPFLALLLCGWKAVREGGVR